MKKHYETCHKAVLKNRNLAKKGSTLKITAPSLPILKKPCCYVNNQNFKIKNGCVEFPVMVNGKSKRIAVKTKMSEKQQWIFDSHKLGTMRIVVKNNTYEVAQIVYESAEPKSPRKAIFLVLILVSNVLLLVIALMAVFSFMAMAVKINICVGIIVICVKNFKKKKHLKAVKRMNDKE